MCRFLFANFCLQLCFGDKVKNSYETFHILKMETHSEKEPHFQMKLTSNVFCSSEGLNLPPSPSIGVIKPEKDLIETISVLSLP